jgi:hypothetical protein
MRFVESADRSIKIQDGASPHADGHKREILRMESVWVSKMFPLLISCLIPMIYISKFKLESIVYESICSKMIQLYIFQQLYVNFTVIKFNVLMKIQKRCRWFLVGHYLL